jgi:Heterokaryon incompatibility protein (HET)
MNLLSAHPDHGRFSLKPFASKMLPKYAILSHVWEADDQEVTFRDLTNSAESTAGYREMMKKIGFTKVQFCAEQAKKDGLKYFWVDTCCIDKSSSADLSQAINSMWRWYEGAAKCYVYLSDVSKKKRSKSDPTPWESAFTKSRWFTRGWTLQELLAPESVEFFSREGELIGDKKSLETQIQKTAEIPIEALRGAPLSQFSREERMSWAANRHTTREEDEAYCLLGLFDAHMPEIYGEGKDNAIRRLEEEIDRIFGLRPPGRSASTVESWAANLS